MSSPNLTPTSTSIIDLYNEIKEGKTRLSPDFQRKLVWSDKHKENFIDTILKGLPFPEIYLADGEVDIETKKVIKWVVDGQQRLNTIVSYIDEKLEKTSSIKPFKELSETEKEAFLYYKVVARSLGKTDKGTIREIFRRINSISYALNAVEIANALYDGEYIGTANLILDENKNILETFDVFSDNQILRMKDLEFLLTIMTTIESSGYFTGLSENEKYIKMYNDKYPNKDIILENINNIFEIIKSLEIDPYSIWIKKANLFTLIVELDRIKHQIKTLDIKKIKLALNSFEKELLTHKENVSKEDPFYHYYLYSIQGTGSKTARIERGKILFDFFMVNLCP